MTNNLKNNIENNFTENCFKFILNHRWMILLFFLLISVVGCYSLTKIKIDAIPDITNKQVVINTKTLGIDPSAIEKTITYPIEAELYGIDGLREMRSLSRFGLSQIILIFDDNIDIHYARNQTLQRLSSLQDKLPNGIKPIIAPLTTGIGEILIYRLYSTKKLEDKNISQLSESKNILNNYSKNQQVLDLMELRTIQEFHLARELKKIKGIAEIDSIGGYERQLHLNANPKQLVDLGMTEKKLIEQIKTIGESIGGGYIENNDLQKIVRTNPNLKSFEDVMNVAVKYDHNGKTIKLGEIVEVKSEHSQRLGSALYNAQDAVIGTVMMQSGGDVQRILKDVKNEINLFNQNNDNVKIEILYDREFLINSTIKTVLKNLGEGIILVILVLCLILGSVKIGLLVASSLIFCVFILAIFMNFFNISANLMSLGAIDFGLLVDSSVVMVEYFLSKIYLQKKDDHKINFFAKLCASVYRPIAIGVLIIVLVYLPILLFGGIEGKTFKPMAINMIICMIASLITAFLLMPVLSFFFIKNSQHNSSKIFEIIAKFYEKILDYSLQKSQKIIYFCILFFVTSMILINFIASDFLPTLNEGDIVFNLVAQDSTSLSKTVEICKNIEKKILETEIAKLKIDKIFSRIGSSQSGLDPMPQNSGDIFLIIKNQFKSDAKSIANQLNDIVKQQCLDCEISYTQPISMRFNEMLEGSRADLSLRIFGEDLEKLIIATKNIKKILHQFPEVQEVNQDFINSIRKGNFIDIIPNYPKIIQHQINLSDVNSDISNAMVGYQVGRYFATEFPISIILHLSEKNRQHIDSISAIPVALNDGGSFPLKEVVSINEVEDIVSIPRLFGKRYSSLSIYLKNTEYEKFIKKANQKISEEKILPQNYKIEWQGRFKNFNNSKRQILLVIPVIILAIFFILYKLFNNLKIILLIFSSIPFALSGAIILLFIFSIKITISVYVGFIALIGISLLNSIILLDHLQKNCDIKQVCLQRLRPILMTAIVASLGFLPMAFAFGIGGEVQQPIAITVIGGIISSTISTLILTPILYNKFINN